MESKHSKLICKHKRSQRPQFSTVSLGKSWFIAESHIKTWKPFGVDDGVLTKYLVEGGVISFNQQICIWETVLVIEFWSFFFKYQDFGPFDIQLLEGARLIIYFPLTHSFSLSRRYSFSYLIVMSQVTAELNLNHDCLAVPPLQAWMA